MFVWRLIDVGGSERDRSEPFADRAGAEAWVAETWETLASDGVADVELLDDGEPVYRMALASAEAPQSDPPA
jgi:hypothetical protein